MINGRIVVRDRWRRPIWTRAVMRLTSTRPAPETAGGLIAARRPALGRLVVDSSVAALLPRAFRPDELAGSAEFTADTVVFLAEGYDAKRLSAGPGLPVHEAVPGTAIRIMTDRPATTLRDIGVVP